MKKIILLNKHIVPVASFLQDAILVNKASRGRNQFIKRLEEKTSELNEAIEEVRKEFFEVDEDGELVVNEGRYEFVDKKNGPDDMAKRLAALDEEELEIHFGEYSSKYEALFAALEETEETLTGARALGYNELLDAYDVSKEDIEVVKETKKTKGDK